VGLEPCQAKSVLGTQLEPPRCVLHEAGEPGAKTLQRTVTAVPLAETISIPPLLPAVMFS